MPRAYGGSFLLEPARDLFTPERFSEEHRAIARAAAEFYQREIAPNSDAIQQQDFAVLLRTLRRSAGLGLVGVLVPEAYGGMEMDLVSSLIVAEEVARDASYASCHGAQAGIGALPVLLFGTAEQKRRYLHGLVSAETVAAYCLTEPHAGSDALAVRTRADLAPDGAHYVLNGQKAWITNGGIADLYTVFAKVDGQFTAFLVERSWPGVSVGAEERKMGLKGSSTTAVYFDNVRVPAENVLGEVGRGHLVAFTILNLGRLHLAAAAQGQCREALTHSLRYARERRAFGRPIGDFGLIRHKLAEMAVRMFANESLLYRLAGEIQDHGPLADAAGEFAIECSLAKVFGSETLGYVTDEAVQIHGGYGYHQDYAVERAYRDARVYRIFEGANEINRLFATAMLLKRARQGALPLAEAVQTLDREPGSDPCANARKIALLLLGAAYDAFGGAIEEQQEVAAGIADVMIQIYAMEPAQARGGDLACVFTAAAMDAIESAARTVLAACSSGARLREDLEAVQRLARREPVNAITLRRQIAARLLEAGRYTP
jgi:alkylation response protein AidB-like acyl-CoA dehydrogenase